MAPPIFNDADLNELAGRGISPDVASSQLDTLRTPPPAVVLARPCTIGDGITDIDPAQPAWLLDAADAAAAQGRVTKFVPASGAATRMFKDLMAALEAAGRPSSSPAAREFFERLDDFPFSEVLRTRARVLGRPETADDEMALLQTLLEDLRYAELPKGLIPFHRGVDNIRTAFEEHLLEGTRYVRAADGTSRMHFTVAPEYRTAFEERLGQLTPDVERQRRGALLDVTFSVQDPSTDTLAIDTERQPFRDGTGALLFRPAGHGALLKNLAQLGGDIITIKNIDNIAPDESSGEGVLWKRLLIGYLTQLQQQTFAILRACDAGASEETLDRAMAWVQDMFSRLPAPAVTSVETKRTFLHTALHRPLRVCGVVRNQGEPGGAPFWVIDPNNTQSRQIVESAQVDWSNPEQARIFRSSTYFNPVDVTCGLRSYDGTQFDLEQFVDPATVFISDKSHEGRSLTALERPGLWNGGMARWNTVFVEVPAATFTPVKTVFDLLRPQHQVPNASTGSVLRVKETTGCVLVVDDQQINQRVLGQILAAGRLESLFASDGARALELARSRAVDLILLDIMLPGLDGYEVLAALRASEETKDIPVIFISSLDGVADKVRGLELGAADYVTKPFNRHEILARVRAQLRIRALTGSLSRANAQLVQKQEVIAEDLRAAADIQQALLPISNMVLPTLDTAWVFQPSMEVGGDIFNVLHLHDGSVALFIADVSGHGVASALLTVSVTQFLSSEAGLLRAGEAVSPADVLAGLEVQYPFDRFGKYFSIALAIISPDGTRIRYSCAGHPPPIVIRQDGAVEVLEVGGPIIGMGFGLEFDEADVAFESGDRLFLYTDGVTEDLSSRGDRFGTDALIAHLKDTANAPLAECCNSVLTGLTERRGDAPPGDDIALVGIERR